MSFNDFIFFLIFLVSIFGAFIIFWMEGQLKKELGNKYSIFNSGYKILSDFSLLLVDHPKIRFRFVKIVTFNLIAFSAVSILIYFLFSVN